MRFLNPGGLWLLLSVPILIIIYLIKSQHEERMLSSTYIWKLSEKFMKKRLPMQKLKKIVLFVLQLLMLIVLAFMAARPAIVNGSSKDYIVIIDSSASMAVVDENGQSRFEKAIEQVQELTEEINKGHRITVIEAADNAYYLVQHADAVSEVKIALERAACDMGSCDVQKALSLAELMAEESNDPEIIFYTDDHLAFSDDIQIVDLNEDEWNVAVENVNAVKKKSGYVFTADITSFVRDAEVTVGLKVDGKIEAARIIECPADEAVSVTLQSAVTYYDTAEVYIEEDDGLEDDNSYSICRKRTGTYSVLLVSRSPLYIQSALEAMGNLELTQVTSLTNVELSGYDLYVFDRVYPKVYPEDGSVILFGIKSFPEGVAAGEKYDIEAELKKIQTKKSRFYNNITLDDTVVSEYTELVASTEWETLFVCGDVPVVVTKDMDNGMQRTVIGFDVHDSNLPMQADFVALMKNIVDYSVPALVKDTDYTMGETVKVTALEGAQSLYVQLPDGSIEELSSEKQYVNFIPSSVGVYTAVMTTEGGGQYADFFVHLPEGEMIQQEMELKLSLSDDGEDSLSASEEDESAVITAAESSQTLNDGDSALSEIWFYLAIALLVLLLIEWGCYYSEQL